MQDSCNTENECPCCGAGLLYYRNGSRARCRYVGCGYDATAKGVVRVWKFRQAYGMLGEGYSIREIARAAGLAKQTVQTIKDQMAREYEETVKCGCGGVAGHKGWCWWRLERSPARQAYLNACAPPARR